MGTGGREEKGEGIYDAKLGSHEGEEWEKRGNRMALLNEGKKNRFKTLENALRENTQQNLFYQ